jgi:hypothetical protein
VRLAGILFISLAASLVLLPGSDVLAQSAKEKVLARSATYVIKAFMCGVTTGNRSYLPKAVRESRQRMERVGFSKAEAKARIDKLLRHLDGQRQTYKLLPADEPLCRKLIAEHREP